MKTPTHPAMNSFPTPYQKEKENEGKEKLTHVQTSLTKWKRPTLIFNAQTFLPDDPRWKTYYPTANTKTNTTNPGTQETVVAVVHHAEFSCRRRRFSSSFSSSTEEGQKRLIMCELGGGCMDGDFDDGGDDDDGDGDGDGGWWW
jgi:hypothetical protein